MTTEGKKKLETTFFEIFGQNHFELLEMLDRYGEYRTLKKGEFLFRENDLPDGFYMILDGFLKVSKSVGEKSEQIIAVLSTGDFSGLSAVMNEHRYLKSTIALEGGASLIYLPKEKFFDWMKKYPTVVIPLLKQLEGKIDRIEDRATFIMRKNIEQRLAYAIVYLKRKFGVDENQFLKLRFTPQDFANFIGTTRTTVYRVFKRFEDNKLINIHNKKIMLLDAEGLEQIQGQQLTID